ncbi:MipA/OmpV family protein [Bordetella holmesii]|uniref:MltA-interacting protein MipA n=2 Tax=Bordetella holmesii TaxID=35814 RepID=A0A158M3N8_9BORD|nr:MipA/OmpV family protein [Bordetella holmesii]AHV93301.1 mltA-interacting MipA family protein [Bordetella holmesii ATCC 51541]AIT25590.1 mltA-interacting MipA family protein [Bordetella holmesii 44057]EWM44313.1 mltA-interacting MipA family protein [Bordetella holmesii 41130]EWM46157.1 mltA-interacting MipA family protein [Bordetella holmesii 35009]EXF89215.1 mltA-interacting MipA family protein [Bordetella holmesii 30539]KAK86473.1 MltA-interacting protein MipA [Bordetella holmesii CDC-H5
MYVGMFTKGALAAVAVAACSQAAAQSQNFIGLGVGVVPVYDGSSEYRTVPLPLINYESGNFFITPRAGLPAMGLKTTLAPDLSAGVFIGANLGRDASDADRTRGIGDIKFHAAYGAYVEWAPGRYSLGAAYRQAAHSGYGGALELRTSYAVLQTERNSVRVGAATQWGSRDDMQTWFGVTSSQAANSREGLSTYSPSAGFKSASVFASWAYLFDARWSLLTNLGVSSVLGDARDSPLNERRTNLFGSVGMVYAF